MTNMMFNEINFKCDNDNSFFKKKSLLLGLAEWRDG